MTRVFVFTNHKGGIGKSTCATNTALDIAGMLPNGAYLGGGNVCTPTRSDA